MTFHSTSTQRRPGGKDEPEDLRQLRREHGGSLATLKELFADWTEEDLLYAIQDAGGDVNLATLRISEGHATQWGEVKGKKKIPKPRAMTDRSDSRTTSQRGGFADRGSRGRGDAFRGGRGGSNRGVPRAHNGEERNGRSVKAESDGYPSLSGVPSVGKTDSTASSAPSWANITARAHSSTEASAPVPEEPASESTNTTTPADDTWDTTASTTAPTTDSWDAPTNLSATTDSLEATTDANATDSWGAPASNGSATARKLNTSTIPAGSKMSWAKIVKPVEPAPQPKPVAAAPKSIPAAAHAPVTEKKEKKEEEKPAEPVPEPVVESTIEPTPAVEDTPEEKPAEPEVQESAPEKKIEEPTPMPASEPEPEPVHAAVSSPAVSAATPVGPPGLKQKPASQPRRLNQDAPVVMPSGSSALHSVGLKFGSFSLNDETESAETEVQDEAPIQQHESSASSALPVESIQPAEPVSQLAQQPSQQPQPATAQTQQAAGYGRQSSTSSAAGGYQAASPATANQTATGANTAYSKPDPAANYLGQQQHHHHPGMGHDAMSSPYGSYMPAANQLGSFGMGPMASLPNDYAALYGNDIQRAMYYDPTSYGQMPAAGANSYQGRDNKYNHDASAAVSTTGAASTSTTQAQQTLQQQQQQQAYPNMAGGMPYYPYYYMAPNQFPNAYQQSGYGQPFINKNMYPMYQQQQQQQHSNKPGSSSSTPYGNYGSTGAGQGSHHQYSQSGYDDMSGAGLHGMGGLGNDPYGKYGNPGMQNFLSGQQQGITPTSAAGSGKSTSGANSYGGSEKSSATGSQVAGVAGGAASLQGQQPAGAMNQAQQAYYQQQMFSGYQYQNHHQGYHPNQHQGQHQGSGRNNTNNNSNTNTNQQFWAQN